MPKIAELKVDADGFWVRLEPWPPGQVVSLYTESEIEHLKKDMLTAAIDAIERSDMPSGWKHRAVDAIKHR